MLLELVKMEVQRQVALAMDAHEQSKHSESKEPTTPQKKGGGPFSKGELVRISNTGHEARIEAFLGDGMVLLKTKPYYRPFKKHYKQLEAI
jgi:hypothetical protein